jgi:hypothetical protein
MSNEEYDKIVIEVTDVLRNSKIIVDFGVLILKFRKHQTFEIFGLNEEGLDEPTNLTVVAIVKALGDRDFILEVQDAYNRWVDKKIQESKYGDN